MSPFLVAVREKISQLVDTITQNWTEQWLLLWYSNHRK